MFAEFCRVYARVRPPAISSEEVLIVDPPNSLRLYREKCENVYDFDRVFPADVQQEEIYSTVAKRIVDGCIDGFNGTIFAYGQTGSGKTFTMMGPPDGLENNSLRGLIPRVADEIFFNLDSKAEKETFKFTVKCVFVELYNEVLYDLLSPTLETVGIGGDRSVVFKNASYENVETSVDLIRLVAQGLINRHVGETNMNRESSRSHAICVIDIEMEEDDGGFVRKKTARLNLVDLAGSERQSHTGSTGDRLKEAGNINKSLLALSKVIRSLASGGLNHIGYRDSKLTHLLRDSLGGNSRTAVIVNLHGNIDFSAETQSTLIFSANCRKIRNQAKSNTEISGDSVVALQRQLTIYAEKIASMENEFELKLEERLRSSTEECLDWQKRAFDFQQQNALYQAEVELSRLVLRESKCGHLVKEETLSNFKNSISNPIVLSSLSDIDKENLILANRRLTSELEELKFAKKELEDQLMGALEQTSVALSQTIMNSPLRTATRQNDAATPKEKKNRRRTMLASATPIRQSSKQRQLFDDFESAASDVDGGTEKSLKDEMERLELALLEKDKMLNEKEKQNRDLQGQIDSITNSHQSQLQCKHSEIQQLSESEFKTRQALSDAERRISLLNTDITQEGTTSKEWMERCKKESKERKQVQQEKAELQERYLEMEDKLAENNCLLDQCSTQFAQLKRDNQAQLDFYRSLEEKYDIVTAEHLQFRMELADKEAVMKDLKAEINRLSLARRKDVEEVRMKYLQENEKLKVQIKDHHLNKAELERQKQELFDACEERVRAAETISAKLREDLDDKENKFMPEATAKDLTLEKLKSEAQLRSYEADENMKRKIEEFRSEFKRKEGIKDIVAQAMESRAREQAAKEEQHCREIEQTRAELTKAASDNKQLKYEICVLNKQLSLSKDELATLAGQLQESSGHTNKSQKIKMFENMRKENFELKQELTRLKEGATRIQRKRDKT